MMGKNFENNFDPYELGDGDAWWSWGGWEFFGISQRIGVGHGIGYDDGEVDEEKRDTKTVSPTTKKKETRFRTNIRAQSPMSTFSLTLSLHFKQETPRPPPANQFQARTWLS